MNFGAIHFGQKTIFFGQYNNRMLRHHFIQALLELARAYIGESFDKSIESCNGGET